jgi:hypothetical protein
VHHLSSTVAAWCWHVLLLSACTGIVNLDPTVYMDCLFVCLFVFCAGRGLVMVQNMHVKGPTKYKLWHFQYNGNEDSCHLGCYVILCYVMPCVSSYWHYRGDARPEAEQSWERSGIVDKLSWDNIPQNTTLQTYKICKLNVILELQNPRCLSNYMMHSPPWEAYISSASH